MAIESAADREQFLVDFGVDITWTRASVAQDPVLGIFDRPTIMVDGSEVMLLDRDASLLCREADLPTGAEEGDPVAIAGESQAYKCRAIRPDGQGFVFVDLKKA